MLISNILGGIETGIGVIFGLVLFLIILGPYFLGKIICLIYHTVKEFKSEESKKSKILSIVIVWIYSLLTVITDIFLAFIVKYYSLLFIYILVQDVIFIIFFISERKGYRRRIIKTILISMIIVSIIDGFFGFIMLKNMSDRSEYRKSIKSDVEIHNEDYEAYFGDSVSAADVKALLQRIKTNNTLHKVNESVDYIYLKVNDEYSSNISEVIKLIRSSKRYKVGILNDAKSNDDEADTGYYKDGKIKTIVITGDISFKENKTDNIEDYNADFKAYFGNECSAESVKSLIEKINYHNSISNNDEIDVLLNGEFIFYSDYNTIINPTSLYKINVLNNFKSDDFDTDAGYYINGRIRTIAIEEVIKEEVIINEERYNFNLAKKSALKSYLENIKNNNLQSSEKIYIIYKGITYVDNIDELYNLMSENNYYSTNILNRNSSDEKSADAGFYNDWNVKTIVIREKVEEG